LECKWEVVGGKLFILSCIGVLMDQQSLPTQYWMMEDQPQNVLPYHVRQMLQNYQIWMCQRAIESSFIVHRARFNTTQNACICPGRTSLQLWNFLLAVE
jgi:hypothetical protein